MDETTTIPLPEAAQVPVSPTPSASATEPETRRESDPVAEGSDQAAAPDKGEEKPRRRASERISELYARQRSAEAETVMARQEVARLQSELARISQARNHPDMPLEQADGLRMREAVKAERLEQLAVEADYKAQAARQHRVAAFQERVQEVKDRLPDFDQVFNDRVEVSEIAADLIADSEYGPQIAYHLGKNPSEAARIARLPPHLQGREIARIEASVSIPVRKVSSAPPPTQRLGGGSSPGAKDPADMSQAEYSEWYRKRSRG